MPKSLGWDGGFALGNLTYSAHAISDEIEKLENSFKRRRSP